MFVLVRRTADLDGGPSQIRVKGAYSSLSAALAAAEKAAKEYARTTTRELGLEECDVTMWTDDNKQEAVVSFGEGEESVTFSVHETTLEE